MDSLNYDAFLHPNVEGYLQYGPTSPYGLNQTSPRLSFNSLNLNTALPDYVYPSPTSFAHTPTSTVSDRPFTPTDAISPPMTNLSGAEDNAPPSGRRSRGSSAADSPSPSHAGNTNGHHAHHNGGLVHRQPLRYSSSGASDRTSPIHGVRDRETRKRLTRAKAEIGSDDDDDEEFQPAASSDALIQKRREEIRRQRIESEQRRRDELRDGYRRLKDVLPVSNQKSSKVSLLDRATTHIKFLESTQAQLTMRLNQAEAETHRLRQVNETLMLSAAEHRVSAPPPPPPY
jgi:hypothetical protein